MSIYDPLDSQAAAEQAMMAGLSGVGGNYSPDVGITSYAPQQTNLLTTPGYYQYDPSAGTMRMLSGVGADPNARSIYADLKNAGLSDAQIQQYGTAASQSYTGSPFDWVAQYQAVLSQVAKDNPTIARQLGQNITPQLQQSSQAYAGSMGTQAQQTAQSGSDPIGGPLMILGSLGIGGLAAGLIGGAGATAAGAGTSGMTAADLAESSALTGSGMGALAGGSALPGGTALGAGLGAAGVGAAGGGMATDSVPSLDQIIANASSAPTLSTTGSPADMFTAGGITTGNTALDASLSGLGGSSLFSSLGNIGSGLSNLSSNPALQQIFSGLGGVGGAAGSLLPGMLALNYANKMTGPDLTNLNTIQSWLMNNQGPVVQAAQDPLLQSQAAGYGDLLQSQAARGIRGSSFGNTDISNYLTTTSRGIADAGTNALLGSMSTAGSLGTNIANLQNQAQQQKLGLYGTAVDALGRALNPSGYAGNIYAGGGAYPGTSGTNPSASSVGALGQLVGGLGSLGSGLYSLFG